MALAPAVKGASDVSSLFTAQNGATILGAYKDGDIVNVSLKAPANCTSGTILATLNNGVIPKFNNVSIGYGSKQLRGFFDLQQSNIYYRTDAVYNGEVTGTLTYVAT